MPRTRWLLREPDEDATTRLFCIPYAGMGASMYAQWPRRLGSADVVLVQPPGRENRLREPHVKTFEDFAEQAVEALTPYFDRPFALYGHCAGSLPAFTIAERLHELGLPLPERVYVASQVPPHLCPHDRYLDMTREQLGAELAEVARAMGGDPHPTLIELALDVLAGDLEPSRLFSRPAPGRLPVGITVLRWDGDDEVSHEMLAAWSEYGTDVRFVDLGGGHYDFLNAPAELMKVLGADLEAASCPA